MADVDLRRTLEQVSLMEREIERMKRDILRSLPEEEEGSQGPSTLFGSVEGGDVTEELINEAKRSLFQPSDRGS